MEKTILNRKNLGALLELLLVLGIGLGIFIYSSTQSLLQRSENITKQYHDSSFYFIVFYEIIALSLIILFLKSRKWFISSFNLDFRYQYIGIALLLVLIRNCISYIGTKTIIAFGMETPSALFQTGLFSTICIIIINSIYEEVILTGYLFKRLENFHPVIIITFGFILRASFHTYQGWGMLPSVLALSLVLGIYYWNYQKLVPVILAHAFGNIFNFLNYHYNWIEF